MTQMICPHCHTRLTDAEMRSLIGRYTSSKRTRHGGGLKAKPTPCPKCGVLMPSVRAAGAHCRVKRNQKGL